MNLGEATQRELFLEVLNRYRISYNLTIEEPYDNGYIIISKNGNKLGEMNYEGYSLLYNLTTLDKMLKGELI